MRCSGKKTFYPSELASAERSLLKSKVVTLKNELNKKIDFIAVGSVLIVIFILIDYYKENLNATATHPASCQEYFDRGETRNGSYTIKPTLNELSFEVSCEFSESKGYTIIKPIGFTKNGKIYPPKNSERCKDPECFSDSIDYGLRLEQIKVNIS